MRRIFAFVLWAVLSITVTPASPGSGSPWKHDLSREREQVSTVSQGAEDSLNHSLSMEMGEVSPASPRSESPQDQDPSMERKQGTASRRVRISSKPDWRNHHLLRDWRRYERVARRDRPQKEIALLRTLEEHALENKLLKDYYDAACARASRQASRNWKERDSLYKALEGEFARVGSPILVYALDRDHLGRMADPLAFAETHRGALESERNTALWRSYPVNRNASFDAILSDYEYILWESLSGTPDPAPASLKLREVLGDRYPARPMLELLLAEKLAPEAGRTRMQELVEEYAGTGFSFLPRERLLNLAFQELVKDKADEAAFRDLCNRCKVYEKERQALKGTEKDIARDCQSISQLIDRMEAPAIDLRLYNDTVLVRFKNTASTRLRLTQGKKTVWTAPARNPARRFYLWDSIRVALPTVEDGTYSLAAEGRGADVNFLYNTRLPYDHFTISAAVRLQEKGYALYAADWETGEPFRELDVCLPVGKKTLVRTIRLDGFTLLPDEFQQVLKKNKPHDLFCRTAGSQGLRQSRRIRVLTPKEAKRDPGKNPTVFCSLFRDKSAYNPGDTLRFKAILYAGDRSRELQVAAGKRVKAVLYDSEDNHIAEKWLETNEYGSVAGVFFLPEERRNGYFSLEIREGDEMLVKERFRADEFVLPSYELTFDREDSLYSPGDSVPVSGCVQSYSGHRLTGVSLSLVTICRQDTLDRAELRLGPDGRFSHVFRAMERGTCRVVATVQDETGETRAFERTFRVENRIRLNIELADAADGDLLLFDGLAEDRSRSGEGRGGHDGREGGKGLLSADTARFIVEARNMDDEKVLADIRYEFLDEKGGRIRQGTTGSGSELVFGMEGLPDGLYVLKTYVEVPDSAGIFIKDRRNFLLVKIREDATVLDAPVQLLLRPGPAEIEAEGHIRISLGAAEGPVWAVATVFGDKGKVLETRTLHLEGKRGAPGSLQEYSFAYAPDYPDAVRFQLFYFRYGREFKLEHTYTRIRRALELPLEYHSFTDMAHPGTEYTVTARTEDDVEGVAAIYDRSLDAVEPYAWQPVRLQPCMLADGYSLTGCGVVTGRTFRRTSVWQVGGDGVWGAVLDENGDPLIGAVVQAKNLSIGTTTDIDGNFSLDIPAGTQLTISYIGFIEAEEIAAPGMVVRLREDWQALDEVVVVAYGARKASMATAVQALSGKVAGLQIRGTASAEPQEPLYVVDGKPMSAAEFRRLDPSAVKSMNILKDASQTAVYGARAANGVIVVSTREAAVPAAEVAVRQVFSDALAFEPFLRAKDGKISFRFKTSDKLSSYHVALFAHDRNLRNNAIVRDMTVTIPVKVSVAAPRLLYEGDRYELTATVTGNSDAVTDGELFLYEYVSGTDPVASRSVPLRVEGRKTASATFPIDLPAGQDTLKLKVVFASSTFSDGLLVTVPVLPALQTVTESHSAVALPGADKDALLATLRKRFVNTSSYGSEYRELSVGAMVDSAVARKREPSEEDILSLSESYCFQAFAEEPDTALLSRMLACRNPDGGFGWFAGMQSSRILTATVLDRMALLRDLGKPLPDLSASVHFLDSTHFTGLPFWYGGISDATYMQVRSRYPSVRFEVRPDKEDRRTYRARLSAFRWFARRYLSPSNRFDFTDGLVLAKARRAKTLQNLMASPDGIALARAWGETFSVDSRLRKSVEEDILSLLEYAVPHTDGGIYFPNAVLPFRGLLESEAYAHSLLCDVFAGYAAGHPEAERAESTAEGIRLWMMLQKETQHWDTDPAYLQAIHAVRSGSGRLQSVSVLTLTQRFRKPFDAIRAAGNGFSVERRFFRGSTELQPGDTLRKGERIRVVCRIRSQENRSFVKLTLPHEAALTPVDPLSGNYSWTLSPIAVDNWHAVRPGGYRNVKPDRTEFFFDAYPEAESTVDEEYFVTQSGLFSAPVAEIESLYAPHYRANASWLGPIRAR